MPDDADAQTTNSVNLQDLEYATPSAYIDPDLPANPTPVVGPDDEQPQEPEQEEPETIEQTPEQIADALKASNAIMSSVAGKIANSRNILIALSGDPSVDELAAAISLSMFLDRLGKHAIAIYSGTTPNALEFLQPADKFEQDADVLQDFVIALDKDKADHLRYKLDGDFVKIFITPYRDKITSDDLDFSYGDYNVDLVLALNVDNGADLDAALREHGRIMHDATVVNITTGNPGKFGEIEWNNKRASSISEMIADLLLASSGDTQLNAEEATALLTGIVAATDRFARANTFPATMQVASKLLDFGADQQLVAANISDDLDNQFFTFSEAKKAKKLSAEKVEKSSDDEKEEKGKDDDHSFSFESTEEKEPELPDDGTALKISHGDEEEEIKTEETPEDEKSAETPETSETEDASASTEPTETEPSESESAESESNDSDSAESSALLDELKATEESLSNTGNTIAPAPGVTAPAAEPTDLSTQPTSEPPMGGSIVSPTMTITPPAEDGVTNKYSQMLEDALAESNPAETAAAPMGNVLPPAEINPTSAGLTPAVPVNPAASVAPEVATAPEINGVPEINYGQDTSGQILPPPPTPPIDIDSPMPMPSMPTIAADAGVPAPGSAPGGVAETSFNDVVVAPDVAAAPDPNTPPTVPGGTPVSTIAEPTPADTPASAPSGAPSGDAFTIPGM